MVTEHAHRLVPYVRKQDGYMRWEMHPTTVPRYFFICLTCGTGTSLSLDEAQDRGLLVLVP